MYSDDAQAAIKKAEDCLEKGRVLKKRHEVVLRAETSVYAAELLDDLR